MSTPGDKRERENRQRHRRAMSLSLMIPAILAAAPLVGLGIGWWLDGMLNSSPWGKLLGLIVGFAAAGREIRKLLQRIDKDLD